ncbi:MAG TPA: Coq4 family protein [Rhizomicrobium sp.]|nr:Coq4 family protein [Rhizomicrobium sp.]
MDATSSVPREIANPPIQPLRAFRALQRLIADKEDTSQVFEIVEALEGRANARGYSRMLRTNEGARQAYLAHELPEMLDDDEWLARFAPGTVGYHYREFARRRNLTASGLVEESRKSGGDTVQDAEHPIAWYARRLRDVHDIWHVLTGYGTDILGEGCVLGFTSAQTRNRGIGFIALAGAWELTRSHWHQPYARAILEGWRLGRKAAWLPGEDYERLFAEPLEAARERLKIGRPTIYHSVPLEARGAYRDPDDRELKIAQGQSLA